MKLKQRIGDFRVRELLGEGVLRERGDFRVFRVTKRKLTTTEAAKILAQEAGVEVGDVGFAGMKDRQAITVQHMTVPRGRKLQVQERDLLVDAVGFADEPLTSTHSRGNAFEIVVRALAQEDLPLLRHNVPIVREHGLVNYFDEQRFGNVRYGQGWIARDLMCDRPEEALKALFTSESPRDNKRFARFRGLLRQNWGDWRACRDIAGRFREHHSVFEHLGRNPGDFAGAFTYVASRLRLIHLYAYQSHVWNRAVAELVRSCVPLEARVVLDGPEGPLVHPSGRPPAELAAARTLRLPGDGCDDVADEAWLARLEEVLAREGLVADSFRIRGVSGFQLKGEERAAMVVPRHLRVRPAENDTLNPGSRSLRMSFELPRGSYATLVVKRLLSRSRDEAREDEQKSRQGGRRARPTRAARRPQGDDRRGRGRRGTGSGPGSKEVPR